MDPDPFRLRLAPLWVMAVVFGMLLLRVVFVAGRMFRAGGLWRIEEQGVTNVKDGVGAFSCRCRTRWRGATWRRRR
jgi:hypothetical protein